MSLLDTTCKDTEYYTPEKVLAPVRAYFGGQIDLDPATDNRNPVGAAKYCTGTAWYEDDGLRLKWSDYRSTFVNPPYGKELRRWIGKIHEEAAHSAHIVGLLPGQRFEQKYFRENIFVPELTSICFVRGRLAFLGPDMKPRKGNPYGTMLYLFNGDHGRFKEHLSTLGYVMRFTYEA